MDTEELSEVLIQIKFVTKQEKHAVPNVPFSVPININTTSLSTLINELLQESTLNEDFKPIEFDFLALGELLRVPLVEHLKERDASTESVIEIEYVERVPPPDPQEALLHDDWVAGVHAADEWVLTGCYDNTVNIWNIAGKHQALSQQHTNCIRAVRWLKSKDPSGGFVSASHDLTAVLWSWVPGSSEMVPKVVLKGHERGIDTVSVNDNATMLVTGGWDTNLKIWSAALEQECDEPPNKKSKGLIVRTPAHTLKGHKETISGSQWIDNGTVCTSSMDHTIKIWDAELCGIKHEIIDQKAFLSLSYSPLTKTILATSADRHIRLYDPRSNEGSICKETYTSHTLWVSSVCWSKSSEFLFMSGSYDNSVKMWDTRSPKASLYDLQGHQDKVLCIDWSNENYLLSGGADNSVNVFRNKN